MKSILLLVLLGCAFSVNAQSLKDALYSGKLRLDTGTVIRKGDDISSRIDTSTRKPVEPPKTVVNPVASDSSLASVDGKVDSAQVAGTVAADGSVVSPATAPDATKDNNRVWNDYMEEFIGTLRTEVVPSKKLKSGNYSILIDYEIDTDGQITVKSVSTSPESSFLEEQVRNRLTLTAPQMTPLLSANGKPRKAPKKHTFQLAK